ncbi:MAG: BMP family ABC transporter substrate-binding protein [Myxococcales bacterium]
MSLGSTRRALFPPIAALLLILSCSSPPNDSTRTVRILYPAGSKGDRSFFDSIYRGYVRASLRYPDLVGYERSTATLDEGAAALRLWLQGPIEGKSDLVIASGFSFLPFLDDLHCNFGQHHVLFLDGTAAACPGLQSVTYRTFAPAYLAAVALQRLGVRSAITIGGMPGPAVVEFMDGFEAGAHAVGLSLLAREFLAQDSAGFAMPLEAETRANALFDSVDAIFPVAGGSGAGVLLAAKARTGKYVIGVDSDQAYLGLGVVVASVVKRLDMTVYRVLSGLEGDRFDQGPKVTGMVEGDTDLVVNDAYFPGLQQTVDEARVAAKEAEKAWLSAK